MYLSNSAFQLLLNCRIVMVAISTILVLGKPINSVEWVAVILLTTGAVQYNLSGCEAGELRINIVGVLVNVVAVQLSVLKSRREVLRWEPVGLSQPS